MLRLKDIILAILSGILLVLVFPRFNLEILAWVAFLPLFYALEGKSPLKSFYLGLIAGLVFFAGILYWIVVVTTTYGKLPYLLGILLLLLLSLYLGLFIASFTFLITYLKRKAGLKELVASPFLWVSLEYLRSLLLTGFPWESLGYSQFLTLPFVQIADFTGVYGVSFLIVLVNALLFELSSNWWVKGKKFPKKEVATVAILMITTLLYGYLRMAEIQKNLASGSTLKVSLAQGNIEQDQKWEPAFQAETIKIYQELSYKAAQEKPDLVIWPETATPFYFQSEQKYQFLLLNLAQEIKAYILLGSLAYNREKEKIRYFNSALLLSPKKEVLERYDKIHLVPFGEYVPLKKVLFFVEKMVVGAGEFSAGKNLTIFRIPQGNFSVLICYEVIFPHLTRKFIQKGAAFLVNITNDAWFGRTAAPYQHLSMATFRAVENRVFLLRAANTGISAIIEPSGKIKSQGGLFTKEVITAKIKIKKITTFYSRFGDVFVYLCLGISLWILTMSRRRKRK